MRVNTIRINQYCVLRESQFYWCVCVHCTAMSAEQFVCSQVLIQSKAVDGGRWWCTTAKKKIALILAKQSRTNERKNSGKNIYSGGQIIRKKQENNREQKKYGSIYIHTYYINAIKEIMTDPAANLVMRQKQFGQILFL